MDYDEFTGRVEAVKARLYRAAYLYLGSEADALEAVDEAVYQALRGLKKLRQPELFETWITRILINECHRELRRRKRILPPAEYPVGIAVLMDGGGAVLGDGAAEKAQSQALSPPRAAHTVIVRPASG